MTKSFDSLVCNIEDYEWDEAVLGAGANGRIKKGVRIRDNFQVAIKFLDETRINSKFDEKKHFIREISYLYSINHPYCLKLINYCFNPFAIITPFMEQGSLEDFINPSSKNFIHSSPTQLMCTIYSVCSTMDAIHSLGLMHRDLKPANILMKLNGDYYDAYIADLGSARIVDQNIDLTECPDGTAYYQSPESCFSSDYTNSVDVYSFGVIFLQYFRYELELELNGKKVSKRAYAIVNAIRNGARYKKPDNMSDEQYNIYVMCTNLNDSLRPTFQELTDMFEKYESLWLSGVNKDQYLQYVNECKNICQEYKKSHQKTQSNTKISLNIRPSIRRKKSKGLSPSASASSSPTISPSSSSSFH